MPENNIVATKEVKGVPGEAQVCTDCGQGVATSTNGLCQLCDPTTYIEVP